MDPLFEDSRIEVGKILGQIEDKLIALPDLQRPFVWPNQKVCKLLDSMFRGYPIGYAYLSYQTNISIKDSDPKEYVGAWRKEVGEESYHDTCKNSALPIDFELMEYPVFLECRRKEMALLVKRGYEKLTGHINV